MNYSKYLFSDELLIQKGSILVPKRIAYTVDYNYRPTALCLREFDGPTSSHRYLRQVIVEPGLMELSKDYFDSIRPISLQPVSVPRWNLSKLNELELDSLMVAIDLQRNYGIGNSGIL